MKKMIIFSIMLVIALSPLFQGLFFPFEMYIAFSILTLLSAAYFGIKFVRKETFASKNLAVYIGIALLLAYFLSFITAVNSQGNMQSIIQYLVYYLVFLVVSDYYAKNPTTIPLFFLAPLLSIGFLTALIGLVAHTNAFPFFVNVSDGSRIGTTLQYANTAAIYFLVLVIFIVSCIHNQRNIYIKALLAGVGSVIFMALFFTSSRGVFLIIPLIAFLIFVLVMPKGFRFQNAIYLLCITLPIFAAMKGYEANSKNMNLLSASKWVLFSAAVSMLLTFIFAYLSSLKVNKKLKIASAGFSSIAVLIVLFVNQQTIFSSAKVFVANNIPQNIVERMSDINLHTQSAFIRLELYKDALKLIKDNWLFGLGGGGFASRYQSVQNIYYAARLVHNHYLQVFSEAGIFGFLSFIFLTVFDCFYFIYARIKLKDNKQQIYIAACFCAFLSLALHSAIDFNLSYGSMSLIYWSLIGFSSAYYFNAQEKKSPSMKSLRIKPPAISMSLAASSVFVLAVCICFSISSHFANMGAYYKQQVEPDKAIIYYTKAAQMDPYNASNHAELADIYSWMAYCSQTENEQKGWLQQALKEGETAIHLDGYYPYYNTILTNVYFSAGENIKACEQAIKLVSAQPRVSGNYELLARGYLEAGLQYIRENNIEKGRDYINHCAAITESPDTVMNYTIAFYQGKALLILGNFSEAEKLLLYAREGSLELKMQSDRLLYIVNEETGRISENVKYKGVVWMGLVKQTPAYQEIKNIINSNILKY